MVTYILKHVKKKRTDHMEINKIKSCQFGKIVFLIKQVDYWDIYFVCMIIVALDY